MPNGCVDSAFERQMNPALNMFTLHFNAVDISGHRFGPTTGIFFFVFLASQVGISSSKLASKFSSPKLFFYYYFSCILAIYYLATPLILLRDETMRKIKFSRLDGRNSSFFIFREIRYLKNMKFVNQCVH